MYCTCRVHVIELRRQLPFAVALIVEEGNMHVIAEDGYIALGQMLFIRNEEPRRINSDEKLHYTKLIAVE